MIRDYVKGLLFLSSYAPLFLILAIKNYTNAAVVGVAGAFIVIPIIYLLVVLKKAEGMSGEFHHVVEVKDESGQFLEYIIAYIIPFLGFNLANGADVVSLIVLFIIVGILYVRSNLIYMNPMLNLMHYTLYKVSDEKDEFMVISKQEITKGKRLKIYFITKKVGVVT